MKSISDHLAESAVLGSVLLDEKSILAVLDRVSPEDFAVPAHRHIFAAMSELARAQQPVDTLTLSSHLTARGQLEGVGGLAFIVGLTTEAAVPTAANIQHYAKRVHDRARLRHLVGECASIQREAPAADDANEFITQAQARLLALTEQGQDEVLPASLWTQRAFKRIEERLEHDSPPALISGLVGLDDSMVLRRTNLITLAARPAMGKSAFAVAVAAGVARRGSRVVLISLEMSEDQLTDRALASEAGLNTRALQRPRYINDDGWPRLHRALSAYADGGPDFWFPPKLSIEELYVRMRREHLIRPIAMVVLDYLQLLHGDDDESREREVATMAWRMKEIARELDCVVLMLGQLNRKVEDRKPPIPILSDLRESGAIEQHSDAVMFLYRPHVYYEDADPEEATLIIGKSRHGPIGEHKMRFEKEIQRFSDEEYSR